MSSDFLALRQSARGSRVTRLLCSEQKRVVRVSWRPNYLRTPKRQIITNVQYVKDHIRLLEDNLEVRAFGVYQNWGVLVVRCSGLCGSLFGSNCRESCGSLRITLAFSSSKLNRLLLLSFGFHSPLLDDLDQYLILVRKFCGDPRVFGLL